ncbi:tRNA lysidine(34) synthetase TilS [Sphingomonas sp.]|uniref:tRNA lysidine(34) synthetase TilS n=1 Tax=Sphingomonas sp. TaxID=28214 RepID=UPI002DD6A470|nr:tRNA lysidine(34) synthetase TilS [Sphingomonas sp.]
MSRRNAGEVDPGDPAAQALARFRNDLGSLIDLERDKVLVAVSGGADSIALLLLTHAVIGERCIAATVDHRLREASASEALFVGAVCRTRGIRHDILTGVLPDRVGRTANLSARARALRYRLLEEWRVARGARWLATAHHADDQLETFVMRANRGAGVGGLAGIRRRSAHIIRPVLGWRRNRLAEIMLHEDVVPVDDPSNSDDRFDRARLRKVLAEVDWLDAARIGDSMAALGEADAALRWTAERAFDERVAVAPDQRSFAAADLPAEIVRRVVVRCLTEIDPAMDADGPGIARLIAALGAGRVSMLGDVLVTVVNTDAPSMRWVFRRAPPRRRDDGLSEGE